MKYIEILKRNQELCLEVDGLKYNIAIISNITIIQLKEILELTLREEGINAEVTVGDYDVIVQDSNRFSEADAVVIFWEAGNLVDGIQNTSYLMSLEELNALEEKIEGEIDLLLRNLLNCPLVLINQFSSALFYSDILRDGALSKLCKRLNTTLANKVGVNQLIVNIDKVLAHVGLDVAVDFRQFQHSKALYSIKFLKCYAESIKPAFVAVNGRSKKVLVLDCDNTLWGGIVGEDGFSNIQMSEETIKGKAFREVQIILRGLRKEGILLALCSKNNPSDVEDVFSDHKDMILKEEDLVAKKINWQDKTLNLCELATELNLGLDSFVFIDDSAFEIGLIQKELPKVKCLQVPQNISEYPSKVRKLKKEFFKFSESSEDERKTEMYKQEKQRKDLSVRFNSIDDYLASLDLKIKISWDNKIPVSRASQMTQKTNQFNLTTKRYTEANVLNMVRNPSYMLATFEVEDNYGDYGVTGMIIIKQDKEFIDRGIIDNFLMSCRIIGRNIEYKIFDEIIPYLREKGISNIQAEYVATNNNSQVEFFYEKIGFNLIEGTKKNRNYFINLFDYKASAFNYIEILK